MSPRPAAPSTASVSACAITSPSEWPGEPARMVDRDPAEHERHAVLERVRVDAEADPQCSWTSRSARAARRASRRRVAAARRRRAGGPTGRGAVDGDHPGGERGQDVVVDPVADVRDLAGRAAASADEPLEERGRRLLDAPARRTSRRGRRARAAAPRPVSCVADGADAHSRAAGARSRHGERVRVEIVARRNPSRRRWLLDAEELPDAPVVLAARGRDRRATPTDVKRGTPAASAAARHSSGSRRRASRRRRRRPREWPWSAGASRRSTSSRSAGVVTFSSRGSPSTTPIAPALRARRATRSRSRPRGRRRTRARSGRRRNACGVCTADELVARRPSRRRRSRRRA